MMKNDDKDKPSTVTVCICTFRRPAMLRILLSELVRQDTDGGAIRIDIAVVDNDAQGTAREVCEEFQAAQSVPLFYQIEAVRNFAIVRNRVTSMADGEYVALIDDDELPGETWLKDLLHTIEAHQASGVLAPVVPKYSNDAPSWLVRSRICCRPDHPTGFELRWSQTRTGNALLRRSLFASDRLQFDPAFRTGGEDVDFFKRAMGEGHRFVWSSEAAVYEEVPPSRAKLSYHIRRALLQGGISLKYGLDQSRRREQLGAALRSAVAIAVYGVVLPVVAVTGFHRAARLLVKQCHHLGRLSTLCGVPLLKERNF